MHDSSAESFKGECKGTGFGTDAGGGALPLFAGSCRFPTGCPGCVDAGASWCRPSDPDQVLDVFVFDAIYLSSFVEEGYLLPIPEEKIQNREDLLPFAMEGCRSDGKLYALPQMLCTDFLYTRKDDSDLSGVSDLLTLYDVLGDRKSRSVIPEKMKDC